MKVGYSDHTMGIEVAIAAVPGDADPPAPLQPLPELINDALSIL